MACREGTPPAQGRAAAPGAVRALLGWKAPSPTCSGGEGRAGGQRPLCASPFPQSQGHKEAGEEAWGQLMHVDPGVGAG